MCYDRVATGALGGRPRPIASNQFGNVVYFFVGHFRERFKLVYRLEPYARPPARFVNVAVAVHGAAFVRLEPACLYESHVKQFALAVNGLVAFEFAAVCCLFFFYFHNVALDLHNC